MFTRGVTAPDESVTVPLMSPEAPTPCAHSVWVRTIITDSTAHVIEPLDFMAPLSTTQADFMLSP